MRDTYSYRRDHISPEGGTAAALRLPAWLHFAASPVFAVMALVTDMLGGGMPNLPCAAAHVSLLTGMTTMYLLMAVFHPAPWLKLASQRWSRVRRATPR